jgi:hypothetical protein
MGEGQRPGKRKTFSLSYRTALRDKHDEDVRENPLKLRNESERKTKSS